ncbi:MAG TPA: MFS transporter [Candidatus Saccharimonadales bacterium]|nr:MFS transporter [Candidatus Saccharimonadales bacterium]
MAETESPSSSRIVFTFPSFTLFQVARFSIVVATEMQSVAVGWQVYEITKRPLDLGLVGLAQFLPGILLFLVSGHVADRYDRRKLTTLCYGGFAACSALLLLLTVRGAHSVYPIYAVLILLGVVRSLNGPVSRALLPQLIPMEHFPSAIAWASTVFQCATILGPSLGGVVYAAFHGPAAVYALSLVCGITAAFSMLRVHVQSTARPREPITLASVFAGFNYIWREKIILGSISLDLFAVLLGGAVALLPVYAGEILRTGPRGLGLLRSAPGAGAAVMAVFLAHKPLRRRAGITMLWCVAGFGLATIIFGLSRSITLSLVALFLVGATDMVSVIVRQTLIQVATPDEMRGRVNSVDMVFIGASNEFGQFESGLTAHWFGTVPAVVLGGIGTIAVTGLWAWIFPQLRKADRLIRTSPGAAL